MNADSEYFLIELNQNESSKCYFFLSVTGGTNRWLDYGADGPNYQGNNKNNSK